MARLIYEIEGVHHQVNLTFEVNVATMTASTFDELVGDAAYTSHSFQQLVAMNGSNLITIDHGDAYPREIQMGVIGEYPDLRRVDTYDLFDFNGADRRQLHRRHAHRPDQRPVRAGRARKLDPAAGRPESARSAPTVRSTTSTRSTSSGPTRGPRGRDRTVRWLTAFSPTGDDDALEPRVVQVGPDRYAVLFSVKHGSGYRMEYRLLDSAGTVLASASFPGVLFCAAQTRSSSAPASTGWARSEQHRRGQIPVRAERLQPGGAVADRLARTLRPARRPGP